MLQVVNYFDEVSQKVMSSSLNVTFFEIVTMIALLQFRDQKVDYAVIECGIGGGLDPTSVVSKVACSAITSIGYDHTEVLGNTLEEIASEKAGIIKEGNKRVILGPTAEPLLTIF